jgi:hypothetical protein
MLQLILNAHILCREEFHEIGRVVVVVAADVVVVAGNPYRRERLGTVELLVLTSLDYLLLLF